MTLKRRQLLALASRLPVLLLATPVAGPGARAAGAEELEPHAAETLQRVAWLLFPFEGLGQGPYRRVVEALAAQASQREAINEGVSALDQLAGGRFLDLEEQGQVDLLREMESGGFFSMALEGTRANLLHDAELWEMIGYEGSSLEFGGYLDHGLEDIDWLPAFPPAEGGGHE